MNEKIRILIVDDSAFMRSALKGMLATDPQMEVIATARDGEEAIEKVRQLKPDMVTMDVDMPRMDGLSAVRAIMAENPLPILMVSSMTSEGAESTLAALEAGAVDFVSKDLGLRSLNIMNIQGNLITHIREIMKRTFKWGPPSSSGPRVHDASSRMSSATMSGNVLMVALGVSTGGPKALQDVIPLLPENFPVPIVIVQHMPQAFTKCFAERLNSVSPLHVKEAEPGEILKPGMVVIAKGGIHLRLTRHRLDVITELTENPKDYLYRPSVNEMMVSAATAYGGRVLGVMMTGMGNDGCVGMHAIKNAGGKTLVQNEETCVVYGMPKAVVDDGVADKIAPLDRLAAEMVNMV